MNQPKITKDDLARLDWNFWLKDRYRLPTGDPYRFEGYEANEAITKRKWNVGDQVFARKCSQIGWSELAISWVLWLNDRKLPNWRGVGYVYPATKQLEDHLKARFYPIMEQDYFRAKLGNANLRMVRWNDRPIFFRGAQTRRDLIGWAADAIVLDEFDEFFNPITIVPTMEARFGNSLYSFLLGLSTPTIPEIGIDQAFKMSNQHHWYIACELCGFEFSPLEHVEMDSFENCVVKSPISGKVGFVCPHCKDLTNTCGRPGHWILESAKDVNKYGYAFSRLFTRNNNLASLLARYEEGLNVQEFYNSWLGLPYAPENARLTRSAITDAAIGPEKLLQASEDPLYMGVDVGKKCHWVVGKIGADGFKHVLSYGACRFEDLYDVARRYNVRHGVIDLRPYEQETKRFVSSFRGILACDFNTGSSGDWYTIVKADEMTNGKTVSVIKADRTQSCDNLIREIASRKKVVFPGAVKGDNNFLNQMIAPVRIDKEDKLTGEIKSLYQSSKADHYFFAMVYLLLAMNVKRQLVARLGPVV